MKWIDKLEAELKNQGCSFYHFEKEICEFANGYLKGKKGGYIRFEKLQKVAEKLGYDIMFFSDCENFYDWYPFLKEQKQQDEVIEQLQILRDDVRGLLDVQKDMTPGQVAKMRSYAEFLKSQGDSDAY